MQYRDICPLCSRISLRPPYRLASAKAAIGVKFGPFIVVNVNDFNANTMDAKAEMGASRSSMAMDGIAPPSTPLGTSGRVPIYASAFVVVSICN